MTPEQQLQASTGATPASNISAGMALCQCWLTPVGESKLTDDAPAYQNNFQAMHDEINKLSGMDADLLCLLAEKLLCAMVERFDVTLRPQRTNAREAAKTDLPGIETWMI